MLVVGTTHRHLKLQAKQKRKEVRLLEKRLKKKSFDLTDYEMSLLRSSSTAVADYAKGSISYEYYAIADKLSF